MLPTIKTNHKENDTTVTVTIPKTCSLIKEIRINLEGNEVITELIENEISPKNVCSQITSDFEKESHKEQQVKKEPVEVINPLEEIPDLIESPKLIGSTTTIARKLNSLITRCVDFARDNNLGYSYFEVFDDAFEGVRCSELKSSLIDSISAIKNLIGDKEYVFKPYLLCEPKEDYISISIKSMDALPEICTKYVNRQFAIQFKM